MQNKVAIFLSFLIQFTMSYPIRSKLLQKYNLSNSSSIVHCALPALFSKKSTIPKSQINTCSYIATEKLWIAAAFIGCACLCFKPVITGMMCTENTIILCESMNCCGTALLGAYAHSQDKKYTLILNQPSTSLIQHIERITSIPETKQTVIVSKF